MTEQKNIGSGNTNISHSNNSISVMININGQDQSVDLLELFGKITKVFEEEDKFINDSFPEKILVNKTNDREEYHTYKIIKSLLQLGIPLAATYEIAQSTIYKIKEFIKSKSMPKLTTKDIRKIVSESIQEISIERFPYEDIENWNNKYIRRYGHNNKRIQIYYPDFDTHDDISYKFINRTLLPDIVNEITKENINYDNLLSSYKTELANEVLSFINSCDLYKINYNVLKDIVKEIALQPPHPWFINQRTQNDIMKYDYECLQNNVNKLCESIKNGEESQQSVKIEVLHHASALILEKYDYFLGCYDLSSFYLLKDLLFELTDPNKWDLTIDYSRTNKLLLELSFSNIYIEELIETTNRINNSLKTHNINNPEFNNLLVKFSDYAIRLYQLGNKDSVVSFLNSKWSELALSDIIENLKLLLYSIYPIKNWNLEKTDKNYFWINYKSIRSKSYPNIKNQILIIYNDGKLKNYSFLDHLTNAKTKNMCNTILAIGENKEFAVETYEKLEAFLNKNNIADKYIVFWLDKESTVDLFNSNNKIKYLDELMLKQMTLV